MKKLITLLFLIPLFSSAQIISSTVTKDLDTLQLQKEKRNRTIKVGSFSYKDSVISYDTTISVLKRYIPPTNVNKPPVANAGSDISITLPVNSVKLDGSASFDPDGVATSLKYYWRKASGPTATITDTNKAIATVNNMVAGTYEFELRVVDLNNAFTADRVTVVVNPAAQPNAPPVARAVSTPSSITLPVSSVTLSAATSSDADGTITSWTWTKVSGPAGGVFSATNQVQTIFSQIATAGTYVFRLDVRDNNNSASSTTINVVVNPQVEPPTQGTTYNINLLQIPYNDPDLNAPGRGIEDWHDQNRINVPVEGTNTQRLDAYYRSQLTWCELEKGQGEYTLTPLINLLNRCISKRQKLSFGIMTVYHDNEPVVTSYDGYRSSYPKYLHDLMQAESVKDWHNSSGWIPNYNSQHYINRLKALHVAVNNLLETGSYQGVKYKDVIYIIDVRGYGNYGEWHNGGLVDQVSQIPSGAHATTASLKAIIDAHTSAFPNFQLSIIMTAFDANWLQHTRTSPEVAYYALTTRNNFGKLGWRRDNWGATDNYIRDLLENNTRTFNGVALNSLIMKVWEYAPVTGEPMNTAPNDYGDLERQVRLYHATSFGNGNIFNTITTALKNNFRAASKASGYRYVIDAGSKIVTASNSITISINWKNAGIAPTYENWDIIYELVNSSGAVAWSAGSNFKLRLFLPQTLYTTSTEAFAVNVPAGTYTLRLSVKDPTGYRNNMPLYMIGRNSDNSINLATGIKY